MPLFEYECSNCYKLYERIGKDEDIPDCPFCLYGYGRRVITKASIRVNGYNAANLYSTEGNK